MPSLRFRRNCLGKLLPFTVAVQFFLCMFFFLETRLKCQWDPRFSSSGISFTTALFAHLVLHAAILQHIPNQCWCWRTTGSLFPASLRLSLTALDISNFLPCLPLPYGGLWSLPLPGSLSLYTKLVMLLISSVQCSAWSIVLEFSADKVQTSPSKC